jgi:hypothetical protein
MPSSRRYHQLRLHLHLGEQTRTSLIRNLRYVRYAGYREQKDRFGCVEIQVSEGGNGLIHGHTTKAQDDGLRPQSRFDHAMHHLAAADQCSISGQSDSEKVLRV